MVHPAKKRRTQSGGNKQEAPVDHSVETVRVLESLTATLDALDPGRSSSSDDVSRTLRDASYSFMKLKSLQRMVLDKLQETQKVLEKQQQQRDEQVLKLENLRYQKVLNEHSIAACQNLERSHLLKLCCDELEKPKSDSNEENERMLEDFLGADSKDPEQRAKIVAKLNEQLNTRAMLEKELKVFQHKAENLKQSLASKRKLLQELPLKLRDMERASLPLQKFAQKALNASNKIGTDRITSLDLAKSLPKALYTLFYHLRYCLDTMEHSGEIPSDETSPVLEIDKNATTVFLKIPIPSVSESATQMRGKKLAKISFQYKNEWDAIIAYSNKENDMEDLIFELFPGDTGGWVNNKDSIIGEKRPYQWCNYIGGLHIAPGEQTSSKMHLSTRVIVRALIRRVRATATLRWLVHSLVRKPNTIPVHPQMTDYFSGGVSSKLCSFTEETKLDDESCPSFCHTYIATFKGGLSSTLNARVLVNAARYPSLPPTWNFVVDESSKSGTSLYDERLASLEHRVNREIEALVVPNDDTTYEWILSHQLAEIRKGWEEYLQMNT